MYKKLMAELDGEHKKLFDAFAEATFKSEALAEEVFFKAGLKIGMRLAFECFDGK